MLHNTPYIMGTPKITLDYLPLELTRYIVTSGFCESVCILLQVNKTINTICSDRLVFKTTRDD